MPAASRPIPSPDRNHAPKRVASTTHRTIRGSVYSYGTVDVAYSESPWVGPINAARKRQACCSHPRCDLNLVRLFRFILSSSADDWTHFLSPSPTHAAINLQPPSCTALYHTPGSIAAVLQSPVVYYYYVYTGEKRVVCMYLRIPKSKQSFNKLKLLFYSAAVVVVVVLL